MSITEDIKASFHKGSSLTKLIYINLAIFVLTIIFGIFAELFHFDKDLIARWLAVPSHLNELMYRPWTIVTYMFLHLDFLHILFNLLWLYWFGVIFLQYMSEKDLTGLYLLGGMSGAALYVLIFSIVPPLAIYNSVALGASASVMAIVIATTVLVPDFRINLMFIGEVKLKYLAMFFIALDMIGIFQNSNVGGHIAHIGGALYGYYYMVQYKKNYDIAQYFNRFLDSILNFFKPNNKPKYKVIHRQKATSATASDIEYNANKQTSQEEMDMLLDKIAKSGYDSLSKEEKEKLFRMSRK